MKHSTTITETARHSFARREYRADCTCGWAWNFDTCRGDIAFEASRHRKAAALADLKAGNEAKKAAAADERAARIARVMGSANPEQRAADAMLARYQGGDGAGR